MLQTENHQEPVMIQTANYPKEPERPTKKSLTVNSVQGLEWIQTAPPTALEPAARLTFDTCNE